MEWVHGRGRQRDRQTGKKQEEEERQERNKRLESELCLADTFKGCTRFIAGGGKAPSYK